MMVDRDDTRTDAPCKCGHSSDLHHLVHLTFNDDESKIMWKMRCDAEVTRVSLFTGMRCPCVSFTLDEEPASE